MGPSVYGLSFGNSKFVSVDGGGASYSFDGISWTSATLPSISGGGTFHSLNVVYGNNFIMTGNITYPSSATLYNWILYSSDGITWTAYNTPSDGPNFTIGYSFGRYISNCSSDITGINTNSRYITSNDGISWTYSNMPSSQHWYQSIPRGLA